MFPPNLCPLLRTLAIISEWHVMSPSSRPENGWDWQSFCEKRGRMLDARARAGSWAAVAKSSISMAPKNLHCCSKLLLSWTFHPESVCTYQKAWIARGQTYQAQNIKLSIPSPTNCVMTGHLYLGDPHAIPTEKSPDQRGPTWGHHMPCEMLQNDLQFTKGFIPKHTTLDVKVEWYSV